MFTFESDNDTTRAERETESFIKKKRLKMQAEELKKKMAVKKLNTEITTFPDFEGI